MPREYLQLKKQEERFEECPTCQVKPFRSNMRGLVQSNWRFLLGFRYCAVICDACKHIVGWERPNEPT